MDLQSRVAHIIEALKLAYPEALCALHSQKDYELMIAVRLSAQCTDERVNLVTPALFAEFPTLESFACADVARVEELVHSCGFYKHKARDIVLACQMLLSDYGGRVPDTMEALLKLPGVGRKTANLLLGDLYAVPGSVVCDTHCIRIAGKLILDERIEAQKSMLDAYPNLRGMYAGGIILLLSKIKRICCTHKIRLDSADRVIFEMPCRSLTCSMDYIVHSTFYVKWITNVLFYKFKIISLGKLTILSSCLLEISYHSDYAYAACTCANRIYIIPQEHCSHHVIRDKASRTSYQHASSCQKVPL